MRTTRLAELLNFQLAYGFFGLLAFGILSFWSGTAVGQVHGTGPSDPALFATVFNVSEGTQLPTQLILNNGPGPRQLNIGEGSIVNSILSPSSGDELNFNGGTVGSVFSLSSNNEVNIVSGNVDGLIAGGQVNLIGGALRGLNSSGELNVSGGTLNGASIGGTANVTGGVLGVITADRDSVVNISGGSFERLNAVDSSVSISGGFVGNLNASSSSDVSITGGNFGRGFTVAEASNVELIGGEFRLNGSSISSTVTLDSDDVLTGTLSDGSAFIFRGEEALFGRFFDVTLTSASLPSNDTNPILINTASTSLPQSLRPGQSLTSQAGGQLGDHFEAVGATLNLEAGSLGDFAEFYQSEVNISGGEVGDAIAALFGSEVNISGGAIGNGFSAFAGSVVNLSGGTVGDGFGARANGQVNVFGTEFFLNGVLLDLVEGEALTVLDRSGNLSGLLADGTRFDLDLSRPNSSFVQAPFDVDSILTVTRVTSVPEPSSLFALLAAVVPISLRRRR